MPKLEWDESFSVKVDQLDNHHKNLFLIVNNFYDASHKTDNPKTLSDIFKRVLDYTKMHFKIEERYMDKVEFPMTEQHKRAHSDLIERASLLYNDISSGKAGAKEVAVTFLKDWLEKHIKGVDTRYSQYMNNAGIQ